MNESACFSDQNTAGRVLPPRSRMTITALRLPDWLNLKRRSRTATGTLARRRSSGSKTIARGLASANCFTASMGCNELFAAIERKAGGVGLQIIGPEPNDPCVYCNRKEPTQVYLIRCPSRGVESFPLHEG